MANQAPSVTSVKPVVPSLPTDKPNSSSTTLKVTRVVFIILALGGAAVVGLALVQYVPSFCFWVGGGTFVLSSVCLTVAFLKKTKENKKKNPVVQPTNLDVNPRSTQPNSNTDSNNRSSGQTLNISPKQMNNDSKPAISIDTNSEQEWEAHLKKLHTSKDGITTKYNVEQKDLVTLKNGTTILSNGENAVSCGFFEDKINFNRMSYAVYNIFSHLDYKEIINAGTVCKEWRIICTSEKFWRYKMGREFPLYPNLMGCEKEPIDFTLRHYLTISNKRLDVALSAHKVMQYQELSRRKILINPTSIHIIGTFVWATYATSITLYTESGGQLSLSITPTTRLIPFRESEMIVGIQSQSNDTFAVIDIATFSMNIFYNLSQEPIYDCARINPQCFTILTQRYIELWRGLEGEHAIKYDMHNSNKDLTTDDYTRLYDSSEFKSIEIIPYYRVRRTSTTIQSFTSIITLEIRHFKDSQITLLTKWEIDTALGSTCPIKPIKRIDITRDLTNPFTIACVMGGSYILGMSRGDGILIDYELTIIEILDMRTPHEIAQIRKESDDPNNADNKVTSFSSHLTDYTRLLTTTQTVNAMLWLGGSLVAISHTEYNPDSTLLYKHKVSILDLGHCLKMDGPRYDYKKDLFSQPEILVTESETSFKIVKLMAGDDVQFYGLFPNSMSILTFSAPSKARKSKFS